MFFQRNFFSKCISKSPLLGCVIGERAFFDFFYTYFLLVLILLPDYFSVFLPRFGFRYLDGVSSSLLWAVDFSLAFLKITRKAINSAIKVSIQEIG